MRSNTIKVRVLATLLSLAAVCAFLGFEASLSASHAATKSVTVTFSAGTPGSLDMVSQKVTATSDLAEKYYSAIAENEPADAVSFADVLVAAHIQKYGDSFKSNPTDYLNMSNSEYGTYMTKQFTHTIVGLYYKNDQSTSGVSTETVSDGDRLYAGSYADWNYYDLYSYFDKASYTATAGSKLSVTLKADNWGSALVPTEATLCTASSSGKLTSLKTQTNSKGTASVTFSKAGTYTLSATGKVTYKGWSGSDVTGQIMPPVATVTVKAKTTAATTGSFILAGITNIKTTKATVKWTKVKGADGYMIYMNRCAAEGKTTNLKKVKTIKGNSTLQWTKTGLLKNKTYKWQVVAYKTVSGKQKILAKSFMPHIITAGGKNYCNPKSVTLNKTSLTLKKGKTAKLKATIVKASSKKKLLAATHCARIRWTSSNKKIAAVTSAGKITAKTAGTCTIYAVAASGTRKACKVTVK